MTSSEMTCSGARNEIPLSFPLGEFLSLPFIITKLQRLCLSMNLVFRNLNMIDYPPNKGRLTMDVPATISRHFIPGSDELSDEIGW